MGDSIFINISIILGLTIFVAFIIQLLKQPLIISYIITGILAGPIFFNLLRHDQEFFQIFAEFGVILLLFLVGLSLNFHFLRKIGKIATITGIGQVIFTSILGFFILTALGFDRESAIYLAIATTFSSTIIILKLLNEKRETETVYGRYTIGLMLVQDIIAILLLVLLPITHEGGSLFLSVVLLLSKSLLFLLVVYLVSRFILKIIGTVAKSGEFLLIFTIAWCFSIAGLAKWLGLSLEVGAIVAGISLGSSVYESEISSRIRPLRDFFIVLFFIILGSQMGLQDISQVIWPGIILSLFILIGNSFILYFLYRFLKFTRKISFKAGLTAAQVSEFGFVFLFIVEQRGYVNGGLLPIFTFVALATIFISSYLIMYNGQIYKFVEPFFRLFGRDKHSILEDKGQKFDVLVFGYHRLGWKICEALKQSKKSFAVIDFDPSAVEKMKERGIPHYFGDATEVEFLSELPLAQAKMIISTMFNTNSQLTMIKAVREKYKRPIIIANLSYARFLDEMYEAGADYVMMPHLISGEWLGDLIKKGKCDRLTMKKLFKSQKEQLKLKYTLPVKN